MATLTQGTLLKLLQSMNSPSRSSRNHRLSLLQVIGIVPALDASDSLWPNQGFLVQLSDSLNSAYVSLSDEDTDLILTNRLQLGQFVYIDRFLFAFPVPRVSSIRPIPSRHTFRGTPQLLVVRISAENRDFVIQPVSHSEIEKLVHPIEPYFSEKFGDLKVKSMQILARTEDSNLGFKNFGKKSTDSVVSNQSDSSLDSISLGNSRQSVSSDPLGPSSQNSKSFEFKEDKVNSMHVMASRENASLDSTNPGLPQDSVDSNKLAVIPGTHNLRKSRQSRDIRKIDEPKDVVRTRQVLAARENLNLEITNLGNSRETIKSAKPQRFSSPSVTRLQRSASTGRKCVGAIQRDPSPVAGKEKRSASPIPSKCEVPSLISARAENRTSSKRASIVVPSRYRQPSPNGTTVRRASVSPLRRMSGIFKVSPMIGDSAKKKKMPSIIVGVSKGDALGGSGKTSRKSWDDGSVGAFGESKEKIVSKNKLDLQGILRTQAAMSTRLSDINIVQPEHNDSSNNSKMKPISSDTVLAPEKIASFISGIMVHDKKWTDGTVSLDAVSNDLARLGKLAMQRRVLASEVAAEALEEAVSMQSIVRSLSKFSEICSMTESLKNHSSIDGFLSLYGHVADSISSAPYGDNHNISTYGSKSVSWVEVALATDLGVVSIIDQNLPRTSSKKHKSLDKDPCLKITNASKVSEWTKGHEISAIDLALKLKSEMESWLLRFVESSEMNLHCVLQSLGVKQFSEWLDLVASERHELAKNIGFLKQKIGL